MPSNRRRTNNKQQKEPHEGVVTEGGSNIDNNSSNSNNAFISNLINLSIMAADTKGDDSSSPSSSSESANQQQTTKEQKQEQQTAAALPTFITNLTIKSPRQKKSSSNNSNNNEQQLEDVTITLPPLRPEEPVASLRGALSEVLGFAHLTKYRLVVEPNYDNDDGNDDEVETSGKVDKSAVVKNNKKKKQQGNHNSNNNLWSPYTLRNADITISPSLKSLEGVKQPLPSSSSKSESESNNKKKEHQEHEEEELVLDDYGDLSILLQLLDNQSGDYDPSITTFEMATDGKKTPTRRNFNASHLSIRVVLEKYDVSSVKDHLVKLRHLLVEGNVPFIDSLTTTDGSSGDDEVAEGTNKVVDEKGEDHDDGKEVSLVFLFDKASLGFL